jgi:phospholipid/cholesterol/gamma-HCH transport system substrate-binding protein
MELNSPEAKVGLFSLAALIMLFAVFYWLNGSNFFQQGYELEAVFDRIEDLRPGAPVKLQGVDVGRISRVYFEDYQVIVAMRIRPQFTIPHNTKAVIASAGVVGDKYLELIIVKSKEIGRTGNRIKGQSPYSMDQFYETAYDVIDSIKAIADSVKKLTNEQSINYLSNSIARIHRVTANLDKLTGGPEVQQLVQNLTLAASELTQASITANRFLTQLDANGNTAAELHRTLANVEKIAENLDKFTAMMASNSPEIELLVKDARQTLQTIHKAVENINQILESSTSGEDHSETKSNLKAALDAAGKLSKYASALEDFNIDNNVGAGYQDETGLIVNYRMDVNLNKKNMFRIGVEDIGVANLTSFQWGVKSPNTLGRFGLYRNEVGLGLDYLPNSKLTFGADLWDTESANVGLSSSYRFNEDWSVKLSASKNIDTTDQSWTVECWRKF